MNLNADIVLKDHLTNSINWDGEAGLQHQFPPAVPHVGTGAAATIVGNGQTLKSLSGIFGHESPSGVPNGGSPVELDFRFMFHSSIATYISDPFVENATPGTTVHLFNDVSNQTDWLTPVGQSSNGLEWFVWTLDVESLGVQTVLGETHLVSFVPETNIASGPTVMAFSNGTAAIGLTEDWFTAQTLGPDTLSNLAAPFPNAAYRVTTTSIPEPGSFSCLSLVILLLGLAVRTNK